MGMSKIVERELAFTMIFIQLTTQLINCHILSCIIICSKAWSLYCCNGRKHRRKHVSDSVPSSSDTREHFDYNMAILTGIVINCSVSSSCSDCSNH